MNRPIAYLLLLALLLTSCFDRKAEQKKITQSWKAYRLAFANNMGSECSKYIDSGSVHYYEYLLGMAINADSMAVEQLRLDQKLAVLLARHTVPPIRIRKMNGKDLFEMLVRKGAGGSAEVVNFNFLSLTPAHAEVQMIDSNGKPGLKMDFNKENKMWKINIASLLGQFSKLDWDRMVKETGKTEHELLYSVLELANNTPPTNNIWHPL